MRTRDPKSMVAYQRERIAESKPATPPEKLEPILPWLMAETVAERRGMPQAKARKFGQMADCWVRWLHANRPDWKRKLRAQDPRPFLFTFLGHWADAYQHNPKLFESRARRLAVKCRG